MRFFLVSIILSLFVNCDKSKLKTNNKENITISTENDLIKDKNFEKALNQAIFIGNSNDLSINTISVVFSNDRLYINISQASVNCLLRPYNYLDINIINRKYYVRFSQEKSILNSYIDVNKLIEVPKSSEPNICCGINGYSMRFEKMEDENYVLKSLSHHFENKDNVILEEDKKYFPQIEEPYIETKNVGN